MLKYCKARGHCLVTGLQMLGIREEVAAKSERAEYWRRKLLSTEGVLSGMTDWSKILESAPAIDDDQDGQPA